MEQKLIEAFDSLIPVEQTLIGGLIVILYNKDCAQNKLVNEVREFLDKDES